MSDTTTILVVDDNREIRDLLGRFLAKHGLAVVTAADGREMWQEIGRGGVDLVVLDLMLPGEDGLSLCRRLRVESDLPVIMLTAMGEETDRIVGLEVGADDYVPKPFSPRELLARIKAVLRRTRPSPTPARSGAAPPLAAADIYEFEDWRLDASGRVLTDPSGMEVALSSGEFDLLLAFLQHPQRVLSRDQLLDLARGRSHVPFDRSIDTQVSRLRRKIERDQKDPRLIRTVWGEGYVFTAKVARA